MNCMWGLAQSTHIDSSFLTFFYDLFNLDIFWLWGCSAYQLPKQQKENGENATFLIDKIHRNYRLSIYALFKLR
jgi:hypothetical protein